jgi:hypothetical protein
LLIAPHSSEPGCAVTAALNAGELDYARWLSWQELRKEQSWLDRRVNEQARRDEEKNGSKLLRISAGCISSGNVAVNTGAARCGSAAPLKQRCIISAYAAASLARLRNVSSALNALDLKSPAVLGVGYAAAQAY